MESDTEWREDGCHIYADLSKGGSDTLEGRFRGSVSYGFQGGKREVWYDGVSISYGGGGKDAFWGGRLRATCKIKKIYYLDMLIIYTDKDKT